MSARLAFVALLFSVIACSPAPRRPLTADEKLADMYWLFSQFNQNYAPMQYKEKKVGFEIGALKARYLEEAKATKSNLEFYALMHRFVAEFRDAHTSSTILSSSLPSRTELAYLGFDGIRKKDYLLVTKVLPTIQATSAYPIKVGDRITKLDGAPLTEIAVKEMVRYRDLGQAESNLSYHLPKIFNRTSLAMPLPAKREAVLTVLRPKKVVTKEKPEEPKKDEFTEEEISLPWVVKDLQTFNKEQKDAAKDKKAELHSMDAEVFFDTVLRCLAAGPDCVPQIIRRITPRQPGFQPWDRFLFVDTMPTWGSEQVGEEVRALANKAETPAEKLAKKRNVPKGAIFVPGANSFPTYITAEKIKLPDNKHRLYYVATMYLDTFSGLNEDQTVKEVSETLSFLQTFGVKDLIIDLIDNGGGSLKLGLRLAQLLSPKRIVMPEIQFKVSETWLDSFEGSSLSGSSDAEKEIARRVFEELRAEQAAGKPLSRPWATETLFPFAFQPHPTLTAPLNVVLLVNDFCASMCDIFTGALKDNKLATIVGSKTMGAGGNVVVHFEAPNSHLMVNQTESLILRRDGSYIENNGVEPDIAVATADFTEEKYTPVRKKAVDHILKGVAP